MFLENLASTSNNCKSSWGLNICLCYDGSADRNGRGNQSPNYMSIKDLGSLGNHIWTYVHERDLDQILKQISNQ